MIPRRLRLHNFLSYRDCELDFTGLHVAVLSGRNGDGKSALLDAMTWALWGKGRGDQEDQRIRTGADEMSVEFEFESRGDVYRVHRKRTRKPAASRLDFLSVADDGTQMPLNGSGVRETQQEIISRLRMDYEVFANSAFIAQGRANEFTTKTAAERKEVFRKVLGLEFYETLSKAAKDRAGRAKDRATDAELRIEGDRVAAAQLPAIEADLATCGERVAEAEPRLAVLETECAELRAAANDYQRRTDEVRRIEREVAAADGDRTELTKRLCGLQEDLDATRALLARGDEIEAKRLRLLAMRDEEQQLSERGRQAADISRRIDGFERAIAEERTRLETKLASLRTEISRLEKLIGTRTAAEEAVAACEAEEAALDRLDDEAKAAGQREGEARETVARSESEADLCRQSAAELKEKQGQLDGAAICPVCRQPLAPEDLSHVQAEYAAQRKALGDRYRAAKEAAAAATGEADEARDVAARLERESKRRRQALAADWREAHAAREAATQAETQLGPVREQATLLDETLATQEFAPQARKASAEATAMLAAVGYEAADHDRVRAEIRDLASVEEEHTGWKLASQRAKTTEDEIARETERLRATEARLVDLQQRLVDAQKDVANATDVRPRLEIAETAVASLRAELDGLHRQQGRLDGERTRLRALHATIERQLDDLKALREEEGTFSELSRGFGKDGVQALLIDQALPRVESIANQMLDLMTGGRIHVALATQKTRRTGVVDTLDINISDDVGTRDYEMYSGGEAFRVDFSLRIALARLLAERSGAELPTLVIDEGFGSQDQEGIDRLVEALTAIGREFRFILVVTHIEELKERFDRRIDVTKDPVEGSFATVR